MKLFLICLIFATSAHAEKALNSYLKERKALAVGAKNELVRGGYESIITENPKGHAELAESFRNLLGKIPIRGAKGKGSFSLHVHDTISGFEQIDGLRFTTKTSEVFATQPFFIYGEIDIPEKSDFELLHAFIGLASEDTGNIPPSDLVVFAKKRTEQVYLARIDLGKLTVDDSTCIEKANNTENGWYNAEVYIECYTEKTQKGTPKDEINQKLNAALSLLSEKS